jgi:hypothetical protein
MAHTDKIGRNDTCSCGSGKKFKKCCESKSQEDRGPMLMFALIGVLVVAGLLAGLTTFSADATDTVNATGVWSPEHGHYH